MFATNMVRHSEGPVFKLGALIGKGGFVSKCNSQPSYALLAPFVTRY
jgi:hypothetical protein